MTDLDERVAREVMGHTWVANTINQPAYATDISAAWLVVERMQSLGYTAEIHVRPDHFIVMFGAYLSEVDDDTAPLAICLAALAAVEGK